MILRNVFTRILTTRQAIKKIQMYLPQLTVNKLTFSSSFQKALSLSDQYRTIYTEDSGLLPWYEQKMPLESICGFNITDQDIISAINQMNTNSAPSADSIYAQYK